MYQYITHGSENECWQLPNLSSYKLFSELPYYISIFRSTRKSRAKRAINKNSYQALVTNCQGQDGQGPSIMIVANQGDVQFALKSYNNDPAVISVPAVSILTKVTYDKTFCVGFYTFKSTTDQNLWEPLVCAKIHRWDSNLRFLCLELYTFLPYIDNAYK